MIHLYKYERFIENVSNIMDNSDKIIEHATDYLISRSDVEIPKVVPTYATWDQHTKLLPTLRNSKLINSFGFILKREKLSDEEILEMCEYLTDIIGKNIKLLKIYDGISNDQHIIISYDVLIEAFDTFDKIFSSILDYSNSILDEFDTDDEFEIITDNIHKPHRTEFKLETHIDLDNKEENPKLLGSTFIDYEFENDAEKIVDHVELDIKVTNIPPEWLYESEKELVSNHTLKIPTGKTRQEVTKIIEDFLKYEHKNNRIIRSWV